MNKIPTWLKSTFAILSIGLIFAVAGLISEHLPAPVLAATTTDNLILNPSLETSTANWANGKWGSSTATFAYNSTGHTGQHSATTTIKSYKSGDAKWYPDPVNVTPNTSYTFSNWYISSVASELDAVVTSATGQVSYMWLATPPASTAWKQNSITFKTPANAAKITFYHVINKNGSLTIDDYDFRLATTTTPPTPTPPPVITPTPIPTPPTVSISNPLAGATVAGTQTISSNVTDAQGISNVKYKLDGNDLATVSTSPYSLSWDSKTVANGTHTLAAVATNTANLSTTSATVSFTVNNPIITPPTPTPSSNTIPNPSVETPDSTGTAPQDWRADYWGTNTSSFVYQNTGHSGNRSLKTTVTNYTSGSANWDYTMQNVSSGHYLYTDWYQSNVATEIDAAVTINGVVQYYYLGSVLPSTTWAQAKAEFDIPAGATSITIMHLIAKNGYLVTDDFSFGPYVPNPFNRGIVTITFDDGWTNQYTNALPLLKKYGQLGTFYLISGELTDQPDYMSVSQIKDIIAAGNEIGSHTITHPDLTTLSQSAMQNEMQQSKITLQNSLGVSVAAFAYPFGAYNANTLTFGKTIYTSQRTVESGYNTKDNFNTSKLLVQNVFSTTTPAQVKAWVDQAIQQHTWLILVYHEVGNTPIDPTDTDYLTKTADLDAELGYIKSSGISVQTIQQALAELSAQL